MDLLTGKKMNILVVDDEELICWSLKRSIEKYAGHSVSCVYTGGEALQKLNESQYDVIITDLKLPDINGTEIVKKIKEMNVDTPVIVVSAYLSQNMPNGIQDEDVFRLINKPFQIEDVLTGVNDAVSGTNPRIA